MSKQVDEIIIEKSLSAIEDEVYLEKLNQILSLKLKNMKQEDLFTMKGKLYRYALQKGYESSLISKWLEEKSFE
jgi:regulatory protein